MTVLVLTLQGGVHRVVSVRRALDLMRRGKAVTVLESPAPPAEACLALARDLYQAHRFGEGERLTARAVAAHLRGQKVVEKFGHPLIGEQAAKGYGHACRA